MVKENLEEVNSRILAACKRAGRNPEEVTLIAVSKTKPASMVSEAYSAGCRDFGENKVQELCEKHLALPEDIRWHMIGHLQRNKVKQVIDKAVLIHSVDSIRLAEQIEEDAARKDLVADILLEVNVAEEESKFGFKLEETESAIRQIARLPHVRIKGLMTIAPFVEKSEENRRCYSGKSRYRNFRYKILWEVKSTSHNRMDGAKNASFILTCFASSDKLYYMNT